MCVDYRSLNSITLPDVHPLPHIDEMIDHIGRSRYFSKRDLHSGLHQNIVDPQDVEKTDIRYTRFCTFNLFMVGKEKWPFFRAFTVCFHLFIFFLCKQTF